MSCLLRFLHVSELMQGMGRSTLLLNRGSTGHINVAPKLNRRAGHRRSGRSLGSRSVATPPPPMSSSSVACAPCGCSVDGQIGKLLRRRDPDSQGFNFFRFVINPDDFGQSVENCFYVSFLIKDGKAGIQVTPEGEVLICEFRPGWLGNTADQ